MLGVECNNGASDYVFF